LPQVWTVCSIRSEEFVAAEQRPVESAAAVRSDHDQVGMPGLRLLRDKFSNGNRQRSQENAFGLDRRTLPALLEDSLSRLFHHLYQSQL
jgi:hypothetical protein